MLIPKRHNLRFGAVNLILSRSEINPFSPFFSSLFQAAAEDRLLQALPRLRLRAHMGRRRRRRDSKEDQCASIHIFALCKLLEDTVTYVYLRKKYLLSNKLSPRAESIIREKN